VWTNNDSVHTRDVDDGVGLRRHPAWGPSRASSHAGNVSLFLRDSPGAAMSGSVVWSSDLLPEPTTLEPARCRCSVRGLRRLLEATVTETAAPCVASVVQRNSDVASEDEAIELRKKDAESERACFGRSRIESVAAWQRRRTPRLRADTRESPGTGAKLQLYANDVVAVKKLLG